MFKKIIHNNTITMKKNMTYTAPEAVLTLIAAEGTFCQSTGEKFSNPTDYSSDWSQEE